MRALFFALVLANVAFFGWAHWVDTSEIAPAPAQEKPGTHAVPRIERDQPCRGLAALPHARPICHSGRCAEPPRRCERAASQPHDRSVERSVEDGYWVYIGDLGSAADQRRALARLEKGGITDASLMSDAEDAGRISVGIFSEQARAVRRAEQVRTLGFKPILDLHQRVQRAFWLDMELHRDQPEPPVTALESATGERRRGWG